MLNFTGTVFENGKVSVDGGTFVDCKFNDTILVYSGGDSPTFTRCAFHNTTWAFDGEAGNTITFLHGLYKSPFRPIVEQMMDFVAGKAKAPREKK